MPYRHACGLIVALAAGAPAAAARARLESPGRGGGTGRAGESQRRFLRRLLEPDRIWLFTLDGGRRPLSREFGRRRVLEVPVIRDSAAVAGVAAHVFTSLDPEAVFGMFPASAELPAAAFQRLVRAGFRAAAEGRMAAGQGLFFAPAAAVLAALRSRLPYAAGLIDTLPPAGDRFFRVRLREIFPCLDDVPVEKAVIGRPRRAVRLLL